MRALRIITCHVIYNSAYNYNCQLKTTYVKVQKYNRATDVPNFLICGAVVMEKELKSCRGVPLRADIKIFF